MDINVCCTILVSFLWAVIYILYKKISNCNIDLLSFGLSKFFIMGIIAGQNFMKLVDGMKKKKQENTNRGVMYFLTLFLGLW